MFGGRIFCSVRTPWSLVLGSDWPGVQVWADQSHHHSQFSKVISHWQAGISSQGTSSRTLAAPIPVCLSVCCSWWWWRWQSMLWSFNHFLYNGHFYWGITKLYIIRIKQHKQSITDKVKPWRKFLRSPTTTKTVECATYDIDTYGTFHNNMTITDI